MIAVGIIIFFVAAIAALLGVMQLLQKGPLLNNAWLFRK